MVKERTSEMYNRITLLGNAQDAGRPQFGCTGNCCEDARKDRSLARMPVSLGLHGNDFGIVETTRCIGDQLAMVGNPDISDIWLTHAHLGHIEGLGQFGRESINLKNVSLHCSESVLNYVKNHLIWQKLFDRGNFSSASFASDAVIPIEVPHRARDFDTHALFFRGISNNLLFLPDHDTWGATLSSLEHDSPRAWFQSLDADIVLLDGTFWDDHELKNRVQTNVPHPPVSQSLELLGNREDGDPRIIFIHLNHTNPLHYPDSEQYQQVNEMGWEVGTEGMEFVL